MIDYKNGKIYTIRNYNDNTLIYVGSTCNTLSQRWNNHKQFYKKNQKSIFYNTVNNNWDDWYIELFEECPCENKEQLNRREGQVIREIATLNLLISGRTTKERYDDNKERINQVQARYREENREKIREWDRKYKEENKEKLKQRNYEWFLNHKEEKYEKRKEKMTCCCGSEIRKDHLKKHEQSNKHITFMENNPTYT